MKSSNIILDKIEREFNEFSTEEKELFIKGKEFIDKATKDNKQYSKRVIQALITYTAYKTNFEF